MTRETKKHEDEPKPQPTPEPDDPFGCIPGDFIPGGQL